jgi:hypothetical protein
MARTSELLELARIGAESRAAELILEIQALQRHFPDLRVWSGENPFPWFVGRDARRPRGGDKVGNGRIDSGGFGVGNGRKASGGAGVGNGRRKRRKMSAAARKRISDAQKKRWAKQKAAKPK